MSSEIYQIHVSLQNSKPKIWRRILIDPNTKLTDFHPILQVLGNWSNSHAYQFEKNYRAYIPRIVEGYDDGITTDAKKTSIKDLLRKENDKITYTYDLGDNWDHVLLLEKILPYNDKKTYPVCIAGKKNFPLEDGGGAYSDEEEELNSDFAETQLGPGYKNYDPEYFDKDSINEKLRLLEQVGADEFFMM